jgi:hypothetical protein
MATDQNRWWRDVEVKRASLLDYLPIDRHHFMASFSRNLVKEIAALLVVKVFKVFIIHLDDTRILAANESP